MLLRNRKLLLFYMPPSKLRRGIIAKTINFSNYHKSLVQKLKEHKKYDKTTKN